MSKIKSVKAREILDSRGNPTIEVTCELPDDAIGKASVPSGASTGIHEAVELRDKNLKHHNGLGVLTAVENVNNEINQYIKDKEFDQRTLDQTLIELDGTKNKSRLGANALLGVSLAFARAEANKDGVELYEYLGNLFGSHEYKLPQPMLNIINGGKHADNGLDIQEFMIGPIGFNSFHEKIRAAEKIIACLKEILEKNNLSVNLGDEGGFAPKLQSNEQALEFIVQAIRQAGYSTDEVKIGIDVAASGLFNHETYQLKIAGKDENVNAHDLINWYEQLVNDYPIILIEDGLAEDDWQGFRELTNRLGNKIKIVGDDLTVTNTERIQKAIEEKAINSVLIKPNQVGTLTETIEAVKLTQNQGWTPFISHRSGETMDAFIADLAVGLSCGFIKSGSLTQNERLSKYNRLIDIENRSSKS